MPHARGVPVPGAPLGGAQRLGSKPEFCVATAACTCTSFAAAPAAGYQYWAFRMAALSAAGIPVKDSSGTIYNFDVALTVEDDGSDAATHATKIAAMVAAGQQDFIMNANPTFAVAESAAVKRRVWRD
eukprot:352578-Chlamydomonas_euryale.AAC.6